LIVRRRRRHSIGVVRGGKKPGRSLATIHVACACRDTTLKNGELSQARSIRARPGSVLAGPSDTELEDTDIFNACGIGIHAETVHAIPLVEEDIIHAETVDAPISRALSAGSVRVIPASKR